MIKHCLKFGESIHEKFIFSNDERNIKIEVKITKLFKTNSQDDNNIGTIIEKYRSSGNNNLSDENKNHIITRIEEETKGINDIENVDGIFCIYPADRHRKYILEKYFECLTKDIDIDNINFSSKFYKNEDCKNLSIKQHSLTENDFTLNNSDLTNTFNKLIIIDDTIDDGKTLNILLEKLLNNKLIKNETEITMHCIYLNHKSSIVDNN